MRCKQALASLPAPHAAGLRVLEAKPGCRTNKRNPASCHQRTLPEDLYVSQ